MVPCLVINRPFIKNQSNHIAEGGQHKQHLRDEFEDEFKDTGEMNGIESLENNAKSHLDNADNNSKLHLERIDEAEFIGCNIPFGVNAYGIDAIGLPDSLETLFIFSDEAGAKNIQRDTQKIVVHEPTEHPKEPHHENQVPSDQHRLEH